MNESIELQQLKTLILGAFASVERPGNWALRGSDEGEEPYLLEKEFQDKTDWRTLDAEFLDQAPDGYSSALSFFSDEAFRYFLPAYLIADLDSSLRMVDPLFHLCHGLDDASRNKPVNPRRFGARNWYEAKRHKFAVFTGDEARAILAYLRYKAAHDAFEKRRIEEAIKNYWEERAA